MTTQPAIPGTGQGTFKGVGDLELFYQFWRPERPRAVVVIVHGFGEHGGRYLNVVNVLAPKGYALYALDHRGHGRSPGQRGHINSWAEYRGDLDLFANLVRGKEAGLPVFVYGHSMGALIVLDYLLHQPQGLKGAVVSGAPIEPGSVAPPLKVMAAKVLSRVWPTFSLPFGSGDNSELSRDPEVVKAFGADPLTHNLVTTRWGTEGLAAVDRVKLQPEKITVPILLVHGEADRMNLVGGVRTWFARLGSTDKTLKTYPESRHEVHNDLDHAVLSGDMAEWLERHL